MPELRIVPKVPEANPAEVARRKAYDLELTLEPTPPAPAAAAAPQPHPPAPRAPAGPKAQVDYSWPNNPLPLGFRTPGQMLAYFQPQLTPHDWQKEELHRLGGYLNLYEDEPRVEPDQNQPLLYNLVAANGSGKDTYIISPTSIWFISNFIRSRVIITTSSHGQMKGQTFKYITAYAEMINAKMGDEIFDIKEYYIYNRYTGSEIIGFVTDDAGKVEGYHPFPDHPNAKMMVIVNEAKSVPDEIYTAADRFSGYSHWLQVSSPGGKAGMFYKRVCEAEENASRNNGELLLGQQFSRRITAFDCPNISKSHIEKVEREHGRDSYLYKTSILAEFGESSLEVVITEALLDYSNPNPPTAGLFVSAGLDLALGGDETEFWIVQGGKPLYHAEVSISSPNRLHEWCKMQFLRGRHEFGLNFENINFDAGGLGAPIGRRLIEDGYPIVGINNQAPAFDSNVYENIGAEMYFRIRSLLLNRRLQLPSNFSCYKKWRNQITTRRYTDNGRGKLILEDKKKAKGRLGFSPDCADAYVLALARYPLEDMLKEAPQETHKPTITEFFAELKASPERLAEFEMRHLQRTFENPLGVVGREDSIQFNVGITHIMLDETYDQSGQD